MTEPTIIIGSRLLAEGQSMTVRVALNNFLIDLQNGDGLGDDQHGRAMTAAYRDRIIEILQLMTIADDPVPPLGEGGLAGTFARYTKRFSTHKGTAEITLSISDIIKIRDALQDAEKVRNDALEEAAQRAEGEPHNENEHDVITVSRCIALGIRGLKRLSRS